EYLGLFAISSMGITLFLGGWLAPFTFLDWIPSWLWFLVKLFGLISIFIWVRGTLPRLRIDQLMNFAWKFMLPMTLINVVVAGLWHFSNAWNLATGIHEFVFRELVQWGARWLICAPFLAIPYVLLGRSIEPKVTK